MSAMKIFGVVLLCSAVAAVTLTVAYKRCWLVPFEATKERPDHARGWIHERRNDTTQLGEFVLNKGETIDNGELAITVVDLTPPPCPRPDRYDSDGSAATFRFTRTSDHKILCEVKLEEDSTSWDSTSFGSTELPFDALSVDAVEA